MRKLAPFLLIAAVLSFAPFIPAPVGPEDAEAAGQPAFPDGGCIAEFTDGGSLVTIDTFRTAGWQASILCDTQVRYKFCDTNSGTEPPTCAASLRHNERLVPNVTYDIGVPSGQRYFSIVQEDAGTTKGFGCCLNNVQPRYLPE